MTTNDPDGIRWFSITGECEHRRLPARWSHGELICPRPLLDRAFALAEDGLTFGDGDESVLASLGAPFPALLTLMRAYDRVEVVRVGGWRCQPPRLGETIESIRR